jgi:hypothetical protein
MRRLQMATRDLYLEAGEVMEDAAHEEAADGH